MSTASSAGTRRSSRERQNPTGRSRAKAARALTAGAGSSRRRGRGRALGRCRRRAARMIDGAAPLQHIADRRAADTPGVRRVRRFRAGHASRTRQTGRGSSSIERRARGPLAETQPQVDSPPGNARRMVDRLELGRTCDDRCRAGGAWAWYWRARRCCAPGAPPCRASRARWSSDSRSGPCAGAADHPSAAMAPAGTRRARAGARRRPPPHSPRGSSRRAPVHPAVSGSARPAW